MYCNVQINKFDIFCRLLQNSRSKRPKVVIPPLCHKREAHILSVAFIYKDLIFLRGQVKGQGKKAKVTDTDHKRDCYFVCAFEINKIQREITLKRVCMILSLRIYERSLVVNFRRW